MTALAHHCEAVGLQAVPIVALMAFLIGVVLAFQGAAQLRQFGADIYVVELISISVLRELGILLTAIIVAGAVGSGLCAAIGSMKMREEIDAMRVLGLDPVQTLVVPRVLALVIMLPILGFVADVAGLVGGGHDAGSNWASRRRCSSRLADGSRSPMSGSGWSRRRSSRSSSGWSGCQAGDAGGGHVRKRWAQHLGCGGDGNLRW